MRMRSQGVFGGHGDRQTQAAPKSKTHHCHATAAWCMARASLDQHTTCTQWRTAARANLCAAAEAEAASCQHSVGVQAACTHARVLQQQHMILLARAQDHRDSRGTAAAQPTTPPSPPHVAPTCTCCAPKPAAHTHCHVYTVNKERWRDGGARLVHTTLCCAHASLHTILAWRVRAHTRAHNAHGKAEGAEKHTNSTGSIGLTARRAHNRPRAQRTNACALPRVINGSAPRHARQPPDAYVHGAPHTTDRGCACMSGGGGEVRAALVSHQPAVQLQHQACHHPSTPDPQQWRPRPPEPRRGTQLRHKRAHTQTGRRKVCK
jgi:hypothetical protein